MATTSPQPRSAYVHVPFCRHRCGYCNFTLIAGRDDLIDDYLRALEIELSWLKVARPVDTLFLGGGTPTHLDPTRLGRLLRLAREWFPPLPNAELTVEANPGDVTQETIDVLAAAGVNRLSLGAQSWNAQKLKVLERDHQADTIHQALRLARPAIQSISLDLMFAAPQETREVWQRDLEQTIRLQPDHVSTYGLTYERGTAFWSRLARQELTTVDDEDERWMYETAIDQLQLAGWEHYEVSNFARPGHRCRHNEVYWTGGEFFAAGPGAARYCDGCRETNHRSTTTYLQRVLGGKSPVVESERLSDEDRARELLVFGLRRLEGVDREWFRERTGFDLVQLTGSALNRFCDQGLMSLTDQRLRLTRRGLLVSDSIWPSFL